MSTDRIVGPIGAGSRSGKLVGVGGAWATISTVTLTTNSSVDFDLSSTVYKDFQLRFYNVAVSAASESLHILVSTNGGGAFLSAAYDWVGKGIEAGAVDTAHTGANVSQMEIGRINSGSNVWGTDAGEGLSGYVDIFFPRDSELTNLGWRFWGNTAGNNPLTMHGGGFHTTEQDTTDIRLIPASGTFDGGILELLGYRE